ncbi:hypothetical protein [Phyllobacterium sp. K27]
MAKGSDLRKALKPLTDRHSDLVLVGRCLYLKPIHHLHRGIFIANSRWCSSDLHPYLSVSELASVVASETRGCGKRLFRHVYGPYRLEDIHRHFWDITRPEIMENMFQTIEDELPRLREIQTFEDYREFVSNIPANYDNPALLEYLDKFVPLLHGDFKPMLVELERNPQKLGNTERFQPGFYPALKANDREAVAKILHEWEADAVKKLKIEKYWERTPFPLEL